MKELKIKIPETKDFKRWASILHFKLTGGFSCNHCGGKSNFRSAQFDSTVNGKRLIAENSTMDICPECTLAELTEKADVVFTESNCNCDWCNTSTSTTSFPRHETLESRLIFGSQWWNGHHICLPCLTEGVQNRGAVHSSNHKHVDGKVLQRNELGMWVEVK